MAQLLLDKDEELPVTGLPGVELVPEEVVPQYPGAVVVEYTVVGIVFVIVLPEP